VAITNYYVRATNGADVAGQGTTHATAYKTPQFALNDIGATHGRNVVDGDQINICDSSLEGANVLAASLTLAAYGTPTVLAPLIIRGYTAAANDGGVGEISCGGGAFSVFSSTTIPIIFVDIKVGNSTVPSTILTVGPYSQLLRVEAHTALSAFSCYANSVVAGCYTHDLTQSAVFAAGAGVSIWGNYLKAASYGISVQYSYYAVHAIGNIIVMSGNTTGIQLPRDGIALGNILYATGANTGIGINLSDSRAGCVIGNNIICGWSGAAAQLADTNPTEMDATNLAGWYVFDLAQAETNAEVGVFAPVSVTANVVLDQVQVFFQDASISSRASQTSLDTIDGIVDAIVVDTGTDIPAAIAALNDLSAAELLGTAVEGTYTLSEVLQLMAAVLFGKTSGGGTTTVTFRNTGDSADRVVATVDTDGNRTAVTLDPT